MKSWLVPATLPPDVPTSGGRVALAVPRLPTGISNRLELLSSAYSSTEPRTPSASGKEAPGGFAAASSRSPPGTSWIFCR